MMKKNLLYVLVILILSGTWSSCSDDNGGSGGDEKPLTPPEVSVQNLSLKRTILPEKKVRLRANIINTTEAALQWFVDGQETSKDTIYEFSSAKEGSFKVKVTASNVLGEASDSLNITVTDGFKISDIRNWTGEGENQSVLAIQWVSQEAEDRAHPEDKDILFQAWGYKWKEADAPSGYDMVRNIVQNDRRLFIIVAEDDFGVAIKGFGYDGNGDGKIEIQSQTWETDHGTLAGIHLTEKDFPADRIYKQKEGENIDEIKVISEGDYWIGGWYKAYPSYWLGSGEAILEAEEYEYSNFYSGNHLLENECWDAWTFSSINSTENNVPPRPDLLQAAPSN